MVDSFPVESVPAQLKVNFVAAVKEEDIRNLITQAI